MIDPAVTELAPVIGFRRACVAVGEAQARWYRRHRQSPTPPKPERVPAPQPRALSEVERKELRAVLNSEAGSGNRCASRAIYPAFSGQSPPCGRGLKRA